MNIVNYLLLPEVNVVFDVDGVLAPYEFGYLSHSMTDEEWDRIVENGENPYDKVSPIEKMKKFISLKDINKIFVCSKCTIEEEVGKQEFVEKNYGILPENIFFVRKQEDKVNVLNHIKTIKNATDREIAIVEDTVKTLDGIRKIGNFVTVHVSSFLDWEK